MSWMMKLLHDISSDYRGTPANSSDTMNQDVRKFPGFFNKFKGKFKVLADIEIFFIFSRKI
jgi:hypothetical protein